MTFVYVICITVIGLEHPIMSELESGKSSGPNDISPESFKFVSNQLSVILSLCFSV